MAAKGSGEPRLLSHSDLGDDERMTLKQNSTFEEIQGCSEVRKRALDYSKSSHASVKKSKLSSYDDEDDADEPRLDSLKRDIEEYFTIELQNMKKQVKIIRKVNEVYKKMQKKIEDCVCNFVSNETLHDLMEELVRERQLQLKTTEVEIHQVMHNINKEREGKEEELEVLSQKIGQCTKELMTKEEELDSKKKLIDRQAKELELIEGRIEELESKEKQLGGRVKLFNLKEEKFVLQERELESQLEELKSKEKLLNGQEKELKSEKKQHEGRVKEFELKENNFEGQVKQLESKKNHYSRQAKELESKEKQLEDRVKEFELEKEKFESQVKEIKLKERGEKRYEVFAKSIKEGNEWDTTIDDRSLQLLPSEKTDEPESLENDILVHLKAASDPSKVALDIIRNFYISQCRKGDNAVIIDRSHIVILEQLMQISPHVKPRVRDEAMRLALDLKANLKENTENSLVVLCFLLLLSIYGLLPSFDEDEVLKLFEFAAQHKQAVELFRTLGFADKVSDFVQNLIKKQQPIEAVRFICAFNLADKNPPLGLLREYMQNAKVISESSCKNTNSLEIKDKAKDQEIATLTNVLQCISDNNLESEDLFDELQGRILELKKQKDCLFKMEEDWKPKLDMVFDSVDDAWKFWVNYGGRVGFGVRKQYIHRKKDGSILSCRFACCKGFVKPDSNDAKKMNARSDTVTNCKVKLGLKYMFGKLMVYDFMEEHNHILNLQESTQQIDLADDADLQQRKGWVEQQKKENWQIICSTKS